MCNKQIYWQGREYPALTLHAERKGWKKPKEKNKENEPVLMEFSDKNCNYSVLFHLLCMQ